MSFLWRSSFHVATNIYAWWVDCWKDCCSSGSFFSFSLGSPPLVTSMTNTILVRIRQPTSFMRSPVGSSIYIWWRLRCHWDIKSSRSLLWWVPCLQTVLLISSVDWSYIERWTLFWIPELSCMRFQSSPIQWINFEMIDGNRMDINFYFFSSLSLKYLQICFKKITLLGVVCRVLRRIISLT